MLGRTIEARAPIPKSAIVWIAISIAIAIGAAVVVNFHLFMLALAPLWLGMALLLNRPASQSLVLDENRFVPLAGQNSIEYASIRSVSIGDKSPDVDSPEIVSGPIRILHDQGQLLLPEPMNLPSVELYRFLVSQILPRPERKVAQSLVEHFDEQTAKFGSDKVLVIHQRDPEIKFHSKSKTRIVGGSMIFSGLIWLLIMLCYEQYAGIPESNTVWIGWGVFFLFVGGLFWLIAYVQPSRSRRHRAKFGRACIVVSPTGLAMDQGDLKGKLSWDEITGIKNASDGKWKGSHDGPLHVLVEGGEVLILDLYEKPLVEVASLIMRNTGRLVG